MKSRPPQAFHPVSDVVGTHAPVWEAESGRGRAFVVSKAPHVALVVMVGDVEKLAGHRIAEALEGKILSATSRIHSFWDLDTLERYHSEVRVRCTEVLRRYRARIASVQTVSQKTLVKMGVSVANLALGGIIIQHERRSDLLAAMRAACAARPP